MRRQFCSSSSRGSRRPSSLRKSGSTVEWWNGGTVERKATMSDTGRLRTTIKIENPLRSGEFRELPNTLVDMGTLLTWAPRPLLEELGITRQKSLAFQTAD